MPGLIQQPDGAFYTLSGEPYNPASEDFGGHYTLTTKDGTVYRINGQSGQLDTVSDRNGNTLSFTAAAVSSSTGKTIVFERDGRNRITAVIDAVGQKVHYAYDLAGNLSLGDRPRRQRHARSSTTLRARTT